ncbi:HdeD family acid-resistance protein [Paracoccus sp. (in: a-proteobacteria)]|uniref:HdeD family acid-resistance protein n=1 Tax=Paracoccus sp. TaxID=267 RepID=UPI0035AFE309
MKNWFLWMIAGLISLLGGFFALANPLAATLTAELLAGWMFVAVGVMTMVSAFGDQGWGGRILSLLIGLVILALGIDLIANPLAGVVSLTLVIGIGLVVMGVLRILLAAGSEFAGLRLVLCMSGAISLLLGAMILSNFPQSAALVLGVYLAVELISNGVSLIVLSLTRKSEPEVA